MTPEAERFNAAQHHYRCITDGEYFFSVTAGVPASNTDAPTSLILSYNGVHVGELVKMTSTNGITTLAGNFLLMCRRADLVTVDLYTGQVEPGPDASTRLERSLITFTAFHYRQSQGRSMAWSVYRESNWTASTNRIDPFTFEQTERLVGVQWSANEVTIPRSGNYYVYLSGKTQPNAALGLTIRRNGVDVFGVYREATAGVETLSHGAVLLLTAGDKLKVVAEPNTAGFSRRVSPSLRQTSFFGFFII